MHQLPRWLQAMIVGVFTVFAAAVTAGKIERVDGATPVADIQLLDQHGQPFGREQFMGRWSMIFAGYTSCPDVCPYTLAVLEAVRIELSSKVMPDRLPQIVFLAVDPKRDKNILESYLNYFNGDFIGITGEKAQIDSASAALGLFYRIEPANASGQYNVSHSSAVAFLNPEGVVVARLYPPFSKQSTATAVYRIMQGMPVEY